MTVIESTLQNWIEEALADCERNVEKFRKERPYMAPIQGTTESVAMGRLHALLRGAYPTLSNLFTETEMRCLMRYCKGSIYGPDTLYALDEFISHDIPLSMLGKKVCRLSNLKKYALMDLVERSWYLYPGGAHPELGLFHEVGVKFKTETIRDRRRRFLTAGTGIEEQSQRVERSDTHR